MKLTAELLSKSASHLNTLHDRELDLRGLKLVVIENLGVTKDQNDSIDLTDNAIRELSGFPPMRRLRHLYLAHNSIRRLDRLLPNALPTLTTLILTDNRIEDLDELETLARFKRLEVLSLMDNPVARQKGYRQRVISRCPRLRFLDFKKVKDSERKDTLEFVKK